jgi:hypothetical protein
MTGNWYVVHDELVAFARHMVETEDWDAKDLIAYLEKPWKWTPEREAWVGLPNSVDVEPK